MSISVPVCHRLIDEIVKRGGQEISDRYIIKKCLNTHILENKRNIVKELVKQSGAKGEYSSFREGISKDFSPRTIGIDEYTSKSVKRLVVKDENACHKVGKEKRKFRSLSMKNKVYMKEEMISTCNHTVGGRTYSSFGLHKENKCKQLVYSIEKQEAFTMEINSKEGKEIETLRNNWIEDERDQYEQIEKTKRIQQEKEKAMAKEKLHFNKELAGNNSFTYHTNGKYIIYSPINQRKSLENTYPNSLGISFQESLQKINSNTAFNDQLRTFRSSNCTTNAEVTLISVPSETKEIENKEEFEEENKEHEFYQQNRRDNLYNNNNRRQTSSLEFVRTKKGICFTEPGKGKSEIEDETSESENLKERKKSSFSKFFTTSQEFKFSKKEKLNSMNLTVEKKNETFPCSETITKLCLPKRKQKTGFKEGKIKYVNESLFCKLIMNA